MASLRAQLLDMLDLSDLLVEQAIPDREDAPMTDGTGQNDHAELPNPADFEIGLDVPETKDDNVEILPVTEYPKDWKKDNPPMLGDPPSTDGE